jgi:hypothetical protein
MIASLLELRTPPTCEPSSSSSSSILTCLPGEPEEFLGEVFFVESLAAAYFLDWVAAMVFLVVFPF